MSSYPHEHRDPFRCFIVTGVTIGSSMVDTAAGDFVPMVRLVVHGRWNQGIDSDVELYVRPNLVRDMLEELNAAADTAEIDHARWVLDGRPQPEENP